MTPDMAMTGAPLRAGADLVLLLLNLEW